MRKEVAVTLAIGMIALTNGCKREVIEHSKTLHEDAKVVQTVYEPSRHSTDVSPTFHLDSDGDPHVGFAVTSISVPETYAVVFQCQHGKFIVEGEDQRHKELWQKLSEGQKVDVTYQEEYRVVYDGTNVVSRDLFKYHFMDAVPKTNSVPEVKAEAEK
jgi:hypothetical protein